MTVASVGMCEEHTFVIRLHTFAAAVQQAPLDAKHPAMRVLARCPEPNKRILDAITALACELMLPTNQQSNKLTVIALATCLAPGFLRNPSNDPKSIMENHKAEIEFVRVLLEASVIDDPSGQADMQTIFENKALAPVESDVAHLLSMLCDFETKLSSSHERAGVHHVSFERHLKLFSTLKSTMAGELTMLMEVNATKNAEAFLSVSKKHAYIRNKQGSGMSSDTRVMQTKIIDLQSRLAQSEQFRAQVAADSKRRKGCKGCRELDATIAEREDLRQQIEDLEMQHEAGSHVVSELQSYLQVKSLETVALEDRVKEAESLLKETQDKAEQDSTIAKEELSKLFREHADTQTQLQEVIAKAKSDAKMAKRHYGRLLMDQAL